MKNVKRILKELHDYFGVRPAGSYLLLDAGIVDSIDDVDILVNKKDWEQVKSYFVNNGYVHELDNNKDIYGTISNIHDVLTVKTAAGYSFDLIKVKAVEQWELIEVMKYKLDRLTGRDEKHILDYIKWRKKNDNK